MGFKKFKEEFSRPIHVNAKPKKTTEPKKPLTLKERQAKADKDMRDAAKARHAAFKANRGKSLGEKSFNKGKPKSEWVKSAYERRQKDSDKSIRDAATKKHDEFQKKHKRGKYSEKSKAKAKAADDKKHGITDKDTKLSSFAKRGGVAGWLNRGRKRLKNMSKDDLTIKFGKNKKK